MASTNTQVNNLVLLNAKVRSAVRDVYGTDRDLDEVIKETSLRLHVKAVGETMGRDANSPVKTMEPPHVSPPLQPRRLREHTATQNRPPAMKRLFEEVSAQ